MAKPEKFIIENFCLKDIFKEDFLARIKDIGTDTFPVSMVLIKEAMGDENDAKLALPIIFNHQNRQEVEEGKLHIESSNPEVLEKVIKALEKYKNGSK